MGTLWMMPSVALPRLLLPKFWAVQLLSIYYGCLSTVTRHMDTERLRSGSEPLPQRVVDETQEDSSDDDVLVRRQAISNAYDITSKPLTNFKSNLIQTSISGSELCKDYGPPYFTRYIIHSKRRNKSYEVHRRYSDFYDFHEMLSRTKRRIPPLPGKRIFGDNYDPAFLDKRRFELGEYLDGLVCGDDTRSLPLLLDFLGIKKDLQDIMRKGSMHNDDEVEVNDALVGDIVDIYSKYRINIGEEDEFEAIGRHRMTEKVAKFVTARKPIQFVLPAFPFKSSSRDKVFGDLPDKGEEMALRTLSGLCQEVELIYPPGAEIVIVSDGRVFADLMNIKDTTVDAYNRVIAQLTTKLYGLRWVSMDVLLGIQTPGGARLALMKNAPSEEEVETSIREDPDKTRTYCGFKIFVTEDLKFDKLSRAQRRKKAGEIAKEMIRRNDAFSKLVEERFPDHVRLSIHPHSGGKGKYGIHLIPKATGAGTPWHNVVVRLKNGGIMMMKKRLAEEAGYRCIYENGQPSYFAELGPGPKSPYT